MIIKGNAVGCARPGQGDAAGRAKAGFIYPLAGAVVPEGFLLCDGGAYSRAEYPELFAAIGTMYGSGDGTATFNVPDLRTRVPVGAGAGYDLGDVGGEAKHTLTVDEMPSHTLNLENHVGTSGGSMSGFVWSQSLADWGRAKTESVGADVPHNNMPPYTVVNYIIATGKDTAVSVADIVLGAQAIPLALEYGGVGATDPKTARENLEITPENIGAVSMELLWENASPESTFPEQDIPCDVSAYSAVIIEVRRNAVNGRLLSYVFLAHSKGMMIDAMTYASDAPITANRAVNITNTIQFLSATQQRANKTSRTDDNTYLVPTRIYGIKGVSA